MTSWWVLISGFFNLTHTFTKCYWPNDRKREKQQLSPKWGQNMHIWYPLFPVVAAAAQGKWEIHRFVCLMLAKTRPWNVLYFLRIFFCMCCATGTTIMLPLVCWVKGSVTLFSPQWMGSIVIPVLITWPPIDWSILKMQKILFSLIPSFHSESWDLMKSQFCTIKH